MDKVNSYVLVTVIALLILAIMIIIHNYKHNRISENELNLSDKNNPKTNGGYTDSIFNALDITSVAYNKGTQLRNAPISYDQIMNDIPIETKRVETPIVPILGGSSHVPYCDEELDAKQLFEMMTRYRRDIIKSFAYNSMWIGFFTSLTSHLTPPILLN